MHDVRRLDKWVCCISVILLVLSKPYTLEMECTSVCTCVSGCTSVCTCVSGCTSVCTCVSGFTPVCTCVSVCTPVCTCVSGCTPVCTCVSGCTTFVPESTYVLSSLHIVQFIPFLGHNLFTSLISLCNVLQ